MIFNESSITWKDKQHSKPNRRGHLQRFDLQLITAHIGNAAVNRWRLFLTLALTIAKVCGVTVEDVFYMQEEEENG